MGTDFGGAARVVDGILLGFVVAGVPLVGGLGRRGGLGFRGGGRRQVWGGIASGGRGHEAGGTVLDPGVVVAVGGEGLALAAGGLDAVEQRAGGVGGAHVAVGHGMALHGGCGVVEELAGVADAVGGLGVGGDDAGAAISRAQQLARSART